MNRYSEKSQEKLSTCHVDLQQVFLIVLQHIDHTVLEGKRDKEDQNKAFNEGKSQLQWPDGKHNVENEDDQSLAVDAIPYPIDWDDRERMSYFAGQVVATGREKGITIRWGGDWDNDGQVKDNSFDDLVHFELVL